MTEMPKYELKHRCGEKASWGLFWSSKGGGLRDGGLSGSSGAGVFSPR